MRPQETMTKRQVIINALRRASYRMPERNQALKKARIARNTYVCNICKETFPRKQIQLDHVEPCIPVEGTNDFNVIIDRMFCASEGYQCLCIFCHKEKTKNENKERLWLNSNGFLTFKYSGCAL